MPTYSRNVMEYAGAVLVTAGTRDQPFRSAAFLTHKSLGLPTATSDYDQLGSSLASADFNGDGYADLAALAAAYGGEGGLVTVPGSAKGLRPRDARLLPKPGVLVPGDALVAGDLNRDGFGDLVVGMAIDGYGEQPPREGSIGIFFGGQFGLTDADARRIGPPTRPSEFGEFASMLALGDVDGDGHLDLVEAAHGLPYILDGEGGYRGHRSYCPGGPTGPISCRPMKRAGLVGPTSLAVADVTGDDRADVVEGMPVSRYIDEDLEESAPSGAVRIWRGTNAGPATKPIVIEKKDPGVPGTPKRNDGFGEAVAVGDLDRDGRGDLVIGSSDERITVLRGGPSGYSRTMNRTFDQDSKGVPGKRHGGQAFGAILSLLDFNGDRRLDLAVGAPAWSDVPASVFTLLGTRHGFTGASGRVLRGRAVGVPDIGEGAFPIGTTPFGAIIGRSGSSR